MSFKILYVKNLYIYIYYIYNTICTIIHRYDLFNSAAARSTRSIAHVESNSFPSLLPSVISSWIYIVRSSGSTRDFVGPETSFVSISINFYEFYRIVDFFYIRIVAIFSFFFFRRRNYTFHESGRWSLAALARCLRSDQFHAVLYSKMLASVGDRGINSSRNLDAALSSVSKVSPPFRSFITRKISERVG